MRKMAEAFLARPPTDEGQGLTPEQQRLGSLCESHEAGVPVYVLYPEVGGGACLRRQEMVSGQSWRAPWIKPGGPNSPYLIPVFKVEPKKGGAESKRRTTLGHFRSLAASDGPVAPYFKAALGVLLSDKIVTSESGQGSANVADAYTGAVEMIVAQGAGAKKGTPLLIVALDAEGDVWPGDDPRLVKWLLESPQR